MIFIYVKIVCIMLSKCWNFMFYLPQETNEIVAIKKFKDSEGKKYGLSVKRSMSCT